MKQAFCACYGLDMDMGKTRTEYMFVNFLRFYADKIMIGL